MKPVTRETFVERRHSPLRWGPILAGMLVAVGVWIALQMLGLGAGLTALDVDSDGSLKGVGIGTGIWSVVAPLIALFIGGFVAARAGRVWDREHAAYHGAVLWALTTVLGVVLLSWTVSSVAGGMMRAGSHAGWSMRGAMSGVDADQLLGPVNDRLRADGKPPVAARELRMALRDVVRDAAAEGDVDRESIITALTSNTDLSRADAEEIAGDVEAQLVAAGHRARMFAQDAADRTGKTLLFAGIALLLGLATAIGGAVLGSRIRDDDDRGRTLRRDSDGTVHVPVET